MEHEPPTWQHDRGGHLWPKDRETVTDDGARIRYTVRGPADAPTVVLCSGYLCPDNFWTYLAPALVEAHRVVLVNYRGVGASTVPREPGLLGRNLRARDYAIERLAGDVVAVLDAESIDRSTFIGHSMGCQVILELYRQLGADRTDGLVFVTGPFRSPFDSFYGTDIAALLFPFVYAIGKRLPSALLRPIPRIVRLPRALDLAQLMRAIGPHTDREAMGIYLRHFEKVDASMALRLAYAMHRYDGSAVLPDVAVPSLVIVGGRDTFTPPEIGEQFCERIDDCELVVLEEGTHTALLEFPDEIEAAVVALIERAADPVSVR